MTMKGTAGVKTRSKAATPRRSRTDSLTGRSKDPSQYCWTLMSPYFEPC